MPTLSERLQSERLALGLSQEALGNSAGVTKQTISAIERGKTLNPDHDTIVAICRRLDITPQWLKTGRGDKRERRGLHVSDSSAVAFASNETPSGYVRLPLLDMEGEMGYGTHNEDPAEVVQFLDVAEWWAKQNLPTRVERIKVISSRGDSMAGVINHGDVVFVDSEISFYDGEGIYVFNWQGRALIKRLAPNLRTGTLQILSANAAAYPPEDVTKEEVDQLHIAGRVIAWWTLKKY